MRALRRFLGPMRARAMDMMNLYPNWRLAREYRDQELRRLNERPIEFAFLFRQLASIYPRTVLDVGTGTTALPHLLRTCGYVVTATDNVRDYWPSGMANRHYHVIDDDITNTRLSGPYDLVTCISVLEHIREPGLAIKNMFALLEPGGHLVVTFPYTERSYVENVYRLPGSSYGQSAPYVTQSYSRSELTQWLDDNGGHIVEQEYWRCWEGAHWTVGRQIVPPERTSQDEAHQLTCLLLRKNEAAVQGVT